mmetsp:Transcript_116926/g.330849  ORF Transcript_116926/g.330849 Transcript_116926/m.330849 type:complete len:249 (-) Transcript_116926:7-753(-)
MTCAEDFASGNFDLRLFSRKPPESGDTAGVAAPQPPLPVVASPVWNLLSRRFLRLSAFAASASSADASGDCTPQAATTADAPELPVALVQGLLCANFPNASRKPRSWLRARSRCMRSLRVVRFCLCAELLILLKTLRNMNCASDSTETQLVLLLRRTCCKPKNHRSMASSVATARSSVRSGNNKLKQHSCGSSSMGHRWKVVVMGPYIIPTLSLRSIVWGSSALDFPQQSSPRSASTQKCRRIRLELL